jgi:hypothetical protein
MSKNENPKSNAFNEAFSMWDGRGKVAYSTYAKEEITIPKGAKILAFRQQNSTPENRRPSIKILWVIEDTE